MPRKNSLVRGKKRSKRQYSIERTNASTEKNRFQIVFFYVNVLKCSIDVWLLQNSLHNRKKRSSNNYLWYSFCFNAFSVQTEFYYFIMIFLLCILIHSFSMLRHTPNADMLMMMLMIFCFVRSDGFSVVLPFV